MLKKCAKDGIFALKESGVLVFSRIVVLLVKDEIRFIENKVDIVVFRERIQLLRVLSFSLYSVYFDIEQDINRYKVDKKDNLGRFKVYSGGNKLVNGVNLKDLRVGLKRKIEVVVRYIDDFKFGGYVKDYVFGKVVFGGNGKQWFLGVNR